MIITVTLNPAMDKTVIIPGFLVGSVNSIETKRMDVGGKGINVSKVIKKLGGESVALGIVGGNSGYDIKNYLNKEEIKHDFVHDKVETRVNIKVIDPINDTYTDMNEQGGPYHSTSYETVEEKLYSIVKEWDIVIFSGSLPFGADEKIYSKWISYCNKKGAKTFLDVNGNLLRKALNEQPYFIKPNNHELEVMSGRKLFSITDYISVSKDILKSGVKKVVISLGEKGALYVSKDIILYGQGIKVNVSSTVGAGDSMVAAFAFGEEKKLSEEETFKLAIATSAASVMTEGTKAPEYDDMLKLLEKVTYKIIKE
jgi:1-phosphofructokinase